MYAMTGLYLFVKTGHRNQSNLEKMNKLITVINVAHAQREQIFELRSNLKTVIQRLLFCEGSVLIRVIDSCSNASHVPLSDMLLDERCNIAFSSYPM